MTLDLTPAERDMLSGSAGDATAAAMRILTAAGEMLNAGSLTPIRSAHIDGCLHHGDGGVEFAEMLVAGGGRVAVPTTLNVGALDLLHPEVVRADARTTEMARRQMDAYVAMGAMATFTCAPYQVGHEPGLGEQVAWGESNAIAFVNSVLGARTERYGDFLDACCALTGRAPLHGLHLEENRRATVVVDVRPVPELLKARDVFYPVLGTWLGLAVGGEVAAILGLPEGTTRDQLKALGAAAASTGAVALFHAVGVTPEAPTLAHALGTISHEERPLDVGTRADRRTNGDEGPHAGERTHGGPDGHASGRAHTREGGDADGDAATWIDVPAAALTAALERLSTTTTVGRVDAVAVGSPHFSESEFETLARLATGVELRVPFYVCTARDTLAAVEARGLADPLRTAGVEIVVDTCVVVTPILPARGGVLMTNSGKFAHYGPSNTGYEVVYGSLEDCVRSAGAGAVVRDEELWRW